MDFVSREGNWAALLRAAVSGDERAYREFFDLITPRLRSMLENRCIRSGLPRSEAEDLVQEVLLGIHLKRGTWDTDRPIGPWISAIVRYKVIDAMRRRGHRANIPLEYVMETLVSDAGQPSFDLHDAHRLVDRLNHPQKEIVKAVSLGGMSISDTARRLKMTEGNVRVSLHRAIKALAGIYRDEVSEHG